MKLVWKRIKYYRLEKILMLLYFVFNSCFIFIMSNTFYEKAIGPATLYDNLINEVYYGNFLYDDTIQAFHFPLIHCQKENIVINGDVYEVYITNGDLTPYGIPIGNDIYFPVSFPNKAENHHVYLEKPIAGFEEYISLNYSDFTIGSFSVSWKNYQSFFSSYTPNNSFILFYDEDYSFTYPDFTIINPDGQELTEKEKEIIHNLSTKIEPKLSTGEKIKADHFAQNSIFLILLSVALVLPTITSIILFFQIQKSMTYAHQSNWKLFDLLGISSAKLYGIILLENSITILSGFVIGIGIGLVILSFLSILPNFLLILSIFLFYVLTILYVTRRSEKKCLK